MNLYSVVLFRQKLSIGVSCKNSSWETLLEFVSKRNVKLEGWIFLTSELTVEFFDLEYFMWIFHFIYNSTIVLFVPQSDFIENHLFCVTIINSGICQLINNLDNRFNLGLYSLPFTFFKNCASNLSSFLALIYNQSLKLSILPYAGKTSFIVPLHESGDKHIIRNYWSISIVFYNTQNTRCFFHQPIIWFSILLLFLTSAWFYF